MGGSVVGGAGAEAGPVCRVRGGVGFCPGGPIGARAGQWRADAAARRREEADARREAEQRRAEAKSEEKRRARETALDRLPGGVALYLAHLADLDPKWNVNGNKTTTCANINAALAAAESRGAVVARAVVEVGGRRRQAIVARVSERRPSWNEVRTRAAALTTTTCRRAPTTAARPARSGWCRGTRSTWPAGVHHAGQADECDARPRVPLRGRAVEVFDAAHESSSRLLDGNR